MRQPSKILSLQSLPSPPLSLQALRVGVLTVLFVCALALGLTTTLTIMVGCGGQGDEPGDNTKYKKDPAPELKLTLFSGKDFDLSALKGKVVVVNFFASWCKPCIEEAPRLEASYLHYRDKGVAFIAVAVQDTEEQAMEFVKETEITFPAGYDSTGDIETDWRILGLPTTHVIDTSGMLSYTHLGGITEDVLTIEIEAQLLEALPQTSAP